MVDETRRLYVKGALQGPETPSHVMKEILATRKKAPNPVDPRLVEAERAFRDIDKILANLAGPAGAYGIARIRKRFQLQRRLIKQIMDEQRHGEGFLGRLKERRAAAKENRAPARVR